MNTPISENTNILEKSVGSRVKSDDPLISIIIPAYNVAAYISETIDSALAQTFKDFEIIVVNDGSPDTEDLEKILETYYDRIIYIKQKNGGAASARNTAILESRGSILAFLDGDDVWFPEKLSSQIKVLENSIFEMIYCNAILFGEPLYESQKFMDKSPSKGEVTPETLLNGNCNVLTSGSIVKKDLVVKCGLFDEKAVRIEDFDLWFRLCKNGVRIGYQQDVLLKYRVRTGSLTGDNVEKAERTIAALQMVKHKHIFTEPELKAWEERLKASKAELVLEKGKNNLVKGNFSEARKNFSEANAYSKNFKLTVLNLLLVLSPKLTLILFKMLRPAEFLYIAASNSHNTTV